MPISYSLPPHLRIDAATPAKIVILTGAGLSAESGLGTFRDVDGLWTKYDLEDVATPQGFARNPDLVLDFYNARRNHGLTAKANAAHHALARLEREHPGDVLTITQNIDSLHEAAGSQNVLHMHGTLSQTLCNDCGARAPWAVDIMLDQACSACSRAACLRPNVVWFGEVPYGLEQIESALLDADIFISIGTSGTVYPAAGFVAAARANGAHTVELNLEPSEGASLFHDARVGKATEIVPEFVAELLQTTS